MCISTGRVTTAKNGLRKLASRSALKERKRAQRAGTPYLGQVGHVPDTTWTGTPEAPFWMDIDPIINSSLGSQAAKYAIGYKPTKFTYKEPETK